MHFVEVAIQNVRGFSPAGRFPLKTGYLILKPPTADVLPLANVALSLLFADGRGGDASLVGSAGRSGKAALTFVGQDGMTYRILRELGGSGSLHRLNPATSQPELVSTDVSEINQYLRGQAGLPPRTTFEQVYCLQLVMLPSRRPRKSVAKAAAAAGAKASGTTPSLAAASQVTPAEDIPAAEAKVKVLQKELVTAKEVDQLQFKVDELASLIFEADSKLKGGEGLKEAIANAEAAWRAAPSPESLGLPLDILTRVKRYPKAVARRDEALARLETDREPEQEDVSLKVPPLTENRFFWGGLGAGVLFMGLSVGLGIVAAHPMWRYLALINIPAFGTAAWMALRYVDDLQHATRKGSKDNRKDARQKKILDEFELEEAPVRMAIKALNLESHTEIPAALEQKDLLGIRLGELQTQLEEYEASPEYQAALRDGQELRAQQETLNAELSAKGTYVRDLREVERELSRLKESIALAKAPPVPVAAAPGQTPAPVDPLEDPSPLVLSQAADVLTTDMLSVQALLKDRCVQYLTALTDRRYQGVEWDREGNAFLLTQNNRIPVGELSPKDIDLYYLALRMTVVEKTCARVKRPFLLDDVLTGVDEAKLPLVARMLKHLGTLTQVLHVTAHPGFGQMSDGTVNV
ncbi:MULTISPECIES: ATP-binding protein [unclassified Corallococcus]|uniref:ATP-binding protein n=1 Tax=unclassified Corallococcus TaxID=2685029 RepID=UPI001A8E960F|nr:MULTISPECIES: chromosome segregation protein SMC [unclassified Corallococcus]MBN9684820.1 chromosome segregation protein SMC [Corallococcus sp. NCSPR001]WAS83715.1 chromosome segregation protein SMC [Corallococcus sp. NCRR]